MMSQKFEALRLGLASPTVGPVSSREEMVRGVAGSAARRLNMGSAGAEEGVPVDGAGRAVEAGVGAEEGVPVGGEAWPEPGVVRLWSTLQRVPGVNVGEDGVGGHSVPGNGRVRGILNVGGRGIGGRDKVESKLLGLSHCNPSRLIKRKEESKLLGLSYCNPSRLVKRKEKGSPDRVASVFGFGGGGGGC